MDLDGCRIDGGSIAFDYARRVATTRSRVKIYRDGGHLVIAGMIKAWSSDEAATSAEPSLYLMSPRQRESASNRYRIKHANSPV